MLIADDANHPPAGANRRIQHGTNAERRQVRNCEFRCTGIVAGVIRGDRSIGTQRFEIMRVVRFVQFDSARILIGRLLIESRATDLRSVRCVEPNAGSLHPENVGRRFVGVIFLLRVAGPGRFLLLRTAPLRQIRDIQTVERGKDDALAVG